MNHLPEFSLISEAFNLAEGQSLAALQANVAALRTIAARHDAEILLTDSSGDPRVRELASSPGIALRVLETSGLSYDEQKNHAATAARGRWLAYLDGDCRPRDDHWLERLTAPLRDGRAEVVGGLTLYDDASPAGIAATVMDFGYIWDGEEGRPGCYSSNNVAFARQLRCEIPIAAGELRCNCYAHTQTLLQRGHPLHAALDAVALHEMPDVASERHRRGWDLIAACWSNPRQIEAAQLQASNQALAWQLRRLQHLDAVRLRTAPAAVGITAANRDAVVRELVRLRGLECVGMREALVAGDRDGRNAEARAAFARWRNTQHALRLRA